jgi:hypothetical protein
MPKPLTTLLELATREPGFGPEFYRCLLESEIYALVPAEGNGPNEGRTRFVMWADATGMNVIPFFSSRAAVRRALTAGQAAFRSTGREFLELTRGANVALDPNEAATCRLSPEEVSALLTTGAVSWPQPAETGEPWVRVMRAVEHPPEATLQSLRVLLARHRGVHRAFLVYCWRPDEPESRCYLVGVRMDPDEGYRLVRESAQVIHDVPPDLAMDLMVFDQDEDPVLKGIQSRTGPFYERSWGERLIVPPSGRLV